jgi:hypothetical protein
MKTIRLILILLALYGASCQKDTILPESGFEEVTLKNLSGFDGCGFVFALSNNKCLEPSNLSDFVTDLKDGTKYLIKYRVSSNQASICMLGEKINIVELRANKK